MILDVEKQTIPCGMNSRSARLIDIDEATGKLAVVRKGRSSETHDYIEFFNILSAWLAVPELTVCPGNGSIENIMFVGNELMTSHANGSVCFIDPHNSERVKRVQISASSIWAACRHQTANEAVPSLKVALVSHSSVLYLFDASSKTISSSISLGVESRLFDVASNGNLVAIGSIDGVILASDGMVQKTLNLDRQNRRDPTIAWSVEFLQTANILACGDSRGTVTLWNTVDGALLQSISCLQSHILTMCVTSDGVLNVSGVDPRIAAIKETKNGMFEVVNRRNGPQRDVRSLAVYENTIYAAGEDFDIYVCQSECRKLLFQNQKNVIVAGEIVASGNENSIDVFWKQPGEDQPGPDENILRQHHEMIYLAQIFSPKKAVITCWTLDATGEHLVIGTALNTSVYQIQPEVSKHKSKIRKIATFSGIVATAVACVGKHVFVAKSDFEILDFNMRNPTKEARLVISQTECGSVVKMRSSPCVGHLCVLTTRSQLFSINVASGQSRLLKVELPIDVAVSSKSLFALTTHPEHSDTRKVLHEVGFNGIVKRSASAHQMRMLPTSPKSAIPGMPVSLTSAGDGKIMVVSQEGHWSILDVEAGTVISAHDGPLKAKKTRKETTEHSENSIVTSIRRKRNSSEEDKEDQIRVIQLAITSTTTPKVAGFKLKKFGMQ